MSEETPGGPPGSRHGRAWDVRVVAIGVGMVLVAALGVRFPDVVPTTFLWVGVVAAAVFATPRATAGLALLGLALGVGTGLVTDQGSLPSFWLRLVAWLAVSVVAVGLARARTRREAHLWDLATSDPLTGLANRRLLLERLEAQLSVRGRTEDAAVLYLDLDRFKQVNDTRGHDIGDAVLVEVAARLRWAVRREDTVARLGGDEFVVACAAIEGEPGVEHLARRITESLQEPIAVRGAPATVGVTIGALLVAPDERPDAEAALHAADSLLLEAKARSGAGVRLLQARYRPAGLPGRTSSVDPAASA